MSDLRRTLIVYLGALHLLLFGLVLLLLRERPLWFIGLELVLVLTFVLGLRLVRRALEPLGYTERLRDLLQDQDYAARLRNDSGGELGQLIALFNDLLSQLHRERLKIGEQQGFLDRLLEATPSAVIVFDFDGNISLINASAQALLQLDAPAGQPLRAWRDGKAALQGGVSAQQRARSLALLEQLEHLPADASSMLNDPDGRRYRGQRGHFYDRGFTRQFLMVEELTEELQSSERATYEKLVRVLGHEVNNTVAATGSVLDSLLYYRDQLTERDGDDFATAIVAVKRRNTRLGEFIERFTHVVKLPEPERRPCAVQDVVEDILWLYREPCRSRGIAIGWRRRDAVAALALDSQMLEQALQNLVKNAMEAAETTMREQGQASGYVHLELANELGGVRLSVIDSGGRLAAVPASQLFTPFFSTKKGGQGIGLLLVREVLTRHGCAYRLASTADGDTSFDIWLQAPARAA